MEISQKTQSDVWNLLRMGLLADTVDKDIEKLGKLDENGALQMATACSARVLIMDLCDQTYSAEKSFAPKSFSKETFDWLKALGIPKDEFIKDKNKSDVSIDFTYLTDYFGKGLVPDYYQLGKMMIKTGARKHIENPEVGAYFEEGAKTGVFSDEALAAVSMYYKTFPITHEATMKESYLLIRLGDWIQDISLKQIPAEA